MIPRECSQYVPSCSQWMQWQCKLTVPGEWNADWVVWKSTVSYDLLITYIHWTSVVQLRNPFVRNRVCCHWNIDSWIDHSREPWISILIYSPKTFPGNQFVTLNKPQMVVLLYESTGNNKASQLKNQCRCQMRFNDFQANAKLYRNSHVFSFCVLTDTKT